MALTPQVVASSFKAICYIPYPFLLFTSPRRRRSSFDARDADDVVFIIRRSISFLGFGSSAVKWNTVLLIKRLQTAPSFSLSLPIASWVSKLGAGLTALWIKHKAGNSFCTSGGFTCFYLYIRMDSFLRLHPNLREKPAPRSRSFLLSASL